MQLLNHWLVDRVAHLFHAIARIFKYRSNYSQIDRNHWLVGRVAHHVPRFAREVHPPPTVILMRVQLSP